MDVDGLLSAVDAANRADPNQLVGPDERGPRALIEGRLAFKWVNELRPAPPVELLLAARSHHLGRWTLPRTEFPSDRAGYLRWRRRLYDVQAALAIDVLTNAGCPPESAERVGFLVAKKGLARDPEARDRDAQTLEDAICLVFLQTQLANFAVGKDEAHVIEIIQKTWAKMGHDGKAAALELSLPSEVADLIGQALA